MKGTTMTIWTQESPTSWSGQMSIGPGGTTIHVMEVLLHEDSYHWYAENDWDNSREGTEQDLEEAQEACEKAARVLRNLSLLDGSAPRADGYITRNPVKVDDHELPVGTYVELISRVSWSLDMDLPDGRWLVSVTVEGEEHCVQMEWNNLHAARLKKKLVPVAVFDPRGKSILACGHTSAAHKGALKSYCEECGVWVRDKDAQARYDLYRAAFLEDEALEMDRRTFIGTVIILSFVPASARAQNPRLVELEGQIREQFGSDTNAVLRTARSACEEVVSEHPDLNRANGGDLDFLTDLALERAVERLNAIGIRV